MSQPVPYDPAYSFTDFSSGSPSSQPPGVKLDGEFNAIARTAEQVLASLARIQRDDGRLVSGIVGLDQLSPAAVAALRATNDPAILAALTALADSVDASAAQVAADRQAVSTIARTGVGRVFRTWLTLQIATGAKDDGAIVMKTDTGSHTDPVTNTTVPNSGTFSYSVSPAGWRYIGPQIAKGDDSTVPGPPGGNIMSISLFSQMSGLSIPIGTDRVQTSGFGRKGLGAAAYVASDDTASPASPSRSLSANGRWFELNEAHAFPEFFGAKGDGATNDTAAFVAMAAYISARGGGVIELSPATYIVGDQTFLHGVSKSSDIVASVTSYLPSRILFFKDLPGSVIIRGNGATMRARDGLRYGTFDSTTGQPNNHQLTYLGSDIGFPYDAMINIENVAGKVEVTSLELDGNNGSYIWGGPRGDTGWQLPATGLMIQGCPDWETDKVNSHHHGLDGIQADAIRSRGRISGSTFHHNCRLGGNLRGGEGLLVLRSDFDFNGKDPTHFSAPAAGLDLEAETGTILRPTFLQCNFRHNRYQQMASASGTVSGGRFSSCTFWSGSDNEDHSVFVSEPGFTFDDCTFGGPLTVLRESVFFRCLFTDDPGLGSLDGTVNTGDSFINTDDAKFLFCKQRVANSALLKGYGGAQYLWCTLEQTSVHAPYQVFAGTVTGCTITSTGLDVDNSGNFYRRDEFTTVNGVAVSKNVGLRASAHQPALVDSATLADVIAAVNADHAARQACLLENPA